MSGSAGKNPLRRNLGAGILCCAAAIAACRPELSAPRESVRVSGVVVEVATPTPTETPTVAATATPKPTPTPTPAPSAAEGSATPKGTPTPTRTPRPPKVVRSLPVGVVAYESCSSRLYFVTQCPGRFLGEAKLAKPGPFVIELDTQAPQITLFAFRGFLDQVEACAEVTLPLSEAQKPVTLELQNGPCSSKLKRPY